MRIFSLITFFTISITASLSYGMFCSSSARLDYENGRNALAAVNCGTGSTYKVEVGLNKSNTLLTQRWREYSCTTSEVLSFGTIPYPTDCDNNIDIGADTPNLETPIMQCGSIVYPSTQTVGESIPIIGTTFNLNYFSSRVLGRKSDYLIKIPITKDIVLPDVTAYDLVIKNDLGITVESETFGTTTNQITTYLTNGLNGSGLDVWAAVKYDVYITENSSSLSPIVSKNELFIGKLKNKKLGIGAWVPSIWYYYDVDAHTLYNPDGTERPVEAFVLPGNFYLIAEKDASLVYIFDSTGKIVETKLGLTGQTIYSFYYDGAGRLSYINQPFSKTTTFNRNGAGVLTSITAPNGKITTVTHDGNDYLATITNPKSEIYEMTYHGTDGLLATFEKPSGVISTFTYDINGNLTKDVHSSGAEINLSKITNLDGTFDVTSTSKMNRENILTGRTVGDYSQEENLKPDGSIFSTENSLSLNRYIHNNSIKTINYISDSRFGNTSRLTSSVETIRLGNRLVNYWDSLDLTDPSDPFSIDTLVRTSSVGVSSYPVTSTYDGSTKTTVTETAMGTTTTTVIDNYQRPTSIQKGSLTPTTMTYTGDKLTQIKQGARETDFTYNTTSQLLESVTNALSETTTFAYDAAERLIKKTLPDLREINYTYDSQGNLTSITPPSRPAHTTTIGANEKPSSYNPPTLTGVPTVNTTYAYNLDNQLTEVNRPDGQSIEYTYGTTSGRLEKITTPLGDYEYTYGLLGSNISLPTIIEAPSGSTANLSYSYGVLSSVTVKDASNNPIYTYSIASSQHAQINSDNLSAGANTLGVTYTYDDDERFGSVGDIYLNYFGWPSYSGFLEGTNGPSLLYEVYAYDSYGEVTQYRGVGDGSPFYRYQIDSRDLLGRITKKTELIRGVSTDIYNYEYDSAGRLVEVKTNNVVTGAYTYDGNSNRTGGNDGSTIAATYDNQDRMTAYKDYTFTYNANGNLASKTHVPTSATTTYSYDVFGNLIQVITPTKTIAYEIDSFNRRLGKKVNGNLVVRYAYDMQNRLIGEINPSGDLIRRYVYINKQHVPSYFIDDTNEKYRLFTDHLGSVRVVVRASDESMVQKMNHNEFGRVTLDTNPGFTPFGFAGGIYDPDTGLLRFGARDYDPEVGRWTSKDPILFNGGDTNLFGYVFNDPVNFIDPNGYKGAKPGGWEDGETGNTMGIIIQNTFCSLSGLCSPIPLPPSSLPQQLGEMTGSPINKDKAGNNKGEQCSAP